MSDRKLLLERLERLAIVLDELMPQCAELVRDAIALLKEQEPVPLIRSAEYEEYWDVENICPKCNARWISLAEDHFCPQCGQAVKWE